jgi:hypothetical protein
MRKAFQIVLSLLVVALITSLVWGVSRRDQPYYKGKSFYTWLLQHANALETGDEKAHREAELAILRIGTNVLPTLLTWLSTRDSPLKKKLLANWPFGEKMRYQLHFDTANDYHARATHACGVLKSIAKPMVPDLIVLLKDPDPDIRSSAAYALYQLGPAAQEAVPALIQSLEDPEANSNAFGALRALGAKPEVVMAAVIAQLASTNSTSRSLALSMLYQSGTNAAAAATDVMKFLTAPDMFLRLEATNVLRKIAPEAAIRAGVR